MHTKVFVEIRHERNGKEIMRIRRRNVMDENERNARYKYIAAWRETRSKEHEANEMQKYYESLNPTSMKKIREAYDEYAESEFYY